MKFNFGHGIFVFFVIFAGSMITLLILSFQQNNDLVAEDYYARELRFQEVIDKKNRAFEANYKIEVTESESGLLLDFSEHFEDPQSITGNIHLYRPSSEKMDVVYPISLEDDGTFEIPAIRMKKGYYQLHLDFEIEGISYYIEQDIYYTWN